MNVEGEEDKTETGGAEGGQTTEAKTEEKTEAEAGQPPLPGWVAKRLAKADRKVEEATQLARTAQQELDALKAEKAQAARSTDGESKAGRTEAEIQAEIDKKAKEEAKRLREVDARNAEIESFNKRADAVYQKGLDSFGKAEWTKAVNAIAEAIDGWMATAENVQLLATIMETSAPEKVILLLGKEPDKADAILGMSPAKQAIELENLARQRIKKASEAPEPPETVEGSRESSPDPNDRDSVAEWMRKRDAEVAKMREQGRRRRLTVGMR